MAAKTIFDTGDQPVVTAKFYNLANVLTSPSSVQVQVRDPAGSVVLYPNGNAAITTTGAGIFLFTFPTALNQSGEWRVKFVGSGGLTAAEETILTVRESKFAYPPV
jgi:hypothetical protein